MANYDVRNAELTILDMIKYDAIKDENDGVIIKDMGGYVQMLVPMDNSKLHDTYDVYFDSNGRMERVEGHCTNSGFVGTKYF
ncbi:MAG: hypothetical protein E7311_01355 [Clostridiales bacterium]|nr:hypothetical protein [Clostridiales bacterium]